MSKRLFGFVLIGITGFVLWTIYQNKADDIFLDYSLGLSPSKYEEITNDLKSNRIIEGIDNHCETTWCYAYWFSFPDGTGMKMAILPHFNGKDLESMVLESYCYGAKCHYESGEIDNLKSLYKDEYGEGVNLEEGAQFPIRWTSRKVDVTLDVEFSEGDTSIYNFARITYEYSDEEKDSKKKQK